MTIKLHCAKCTFKVEAALKKGAHLSSDDLKNMAQFFGLEPSPEGYICEDCRKKQEVCHDKRLYGRCTRPAGAAFHGERH